MFDSCSPGMHSWSGSQHSSWTASVDSRSRRVSGDDDAVLRRPVHSASAAHRAGYQHCGLVALDYLTNVARLGNNDPVVVGVRRIVERGSRTARDRNRTSRRRHQATRRPVDQENTRPTPPADFNAGSAPSTTPSAPCDRLSNSSQCDQSHVTSSHRQVLRENRMTSVEPSRHLVFPQNCKDRLLSDTGFCSRQGFGDGRTVTSREETHQATSTKTPDVTLCAGELERLAQTDVRVATVLSELMDLLDEESRDAESN